MLGKLSANYLFREAIIFRERSWRKSVSIEEQIVFKDKFLSIFFREMKYIIVLILQINLSQAEYWRVNVSNNQRKL